MAQMIEVQLELNIQNAPESDVRLALMQKQIDGIHDSMGKVRRRIFAEVSEMKKLYVSLQQENEMLKNELALLKDQKTEWLYCQDGFLLKQA
jgi:hypothetical protein